MELNNKELIKHMEKWTSIPFSKEDHIKSFDEKMAHFKDHVAPCALKFDTINGENWLKDDLQLIFVRPIFRAYLHGELIRLLGYDGAKTVLYNAAYQYGLKDAKNYLDYMGKSLEKPTPYFNDILYASMGWGVWQTVKFDVEKGQLLLRGWNRQEVTDYVNNYGETNRSICYIQQGFVASICTVMFERDINVIETKCVAKGDEYCEYYAFPRESLEVVNITDKLKATLKLLKETPGVKASAVVSCAGDIFASVFQTNIENDKVAKMTATILSVATQAGIELKQGEFNSIFIDSVEGYITLAQIGTEAVLVVLTSKKIPIGSILLKVKRTAQQIVEKKLLKVYNRI